VADLFPQSNALYHQSHYPRTVTCSCSLQVFLFWTCKTGGANFYTTKLIDNAAGRYCSTARNSITLQNLLVKYKNRKLRIGNDWLPILYRPTGVYTINLPMTLTRKIITVKTAWRHCSTTFGSWFSVNEHFLQHKIHIRILYT